MGHVEVAPADWISFINLSFDLNRDFKINKERSFQQENTAEVLIQRAGYYRKIIWVSFSIKFITLHLSTNWFNGELLK